MRLGFEHGPFLELEVTGYEFPGADRRMETWGANWLNIRGRVHLADGRKWEFTHPCLTTFEGAQLGSWLHSLSTGDAHLLLGHAGGAAPRLFFTEPLLAFEAERTSDATLTICVILELEALPPSGLWEQRSGVEEFVVAVSLARHELAVAAHQWAQDLAPFPER